MKITVPRDHIHAGVFYPAGSQVELSETEIAWLMQAEGATREKLVAEAPQPITFPEPSETETIEVESLSQDADEPNVSESEEAAE